MPERVLLTGASSGIGLELAKLFAQAGSELFIAARRKDQLVFLQEDLEATYGTKATVLAEDLADPEVPARLAEQVGEIDVLVNNAGFGMRGAFHELPWARQSAMVQLNVTTLADLTHRLVPGMVRRGRGGVLNVASTAAFAPGPYMATYYATKAFVLSFSEALHHELRGTGVKVSCLCPGATKTEFAEIADLDQSKLFRGGVMSAAKVAEAGYRGFRAGRAVVLPGASNRLAPLAARLLPRGVVRRFIAGLQTPPAK